MNADATRGRAASVPGASVVRLRLALPLRIYALRVYCLTALCVSVAQLRSARAAQTMRQLCSGGVQRSDFYGETPALMPGMRDAICGSMLRPWCSVRTVTYCARVCTCPVRIADTCDKMSR